MTEALKQAISVLCDCRDALRECDRDGDYKLIGLIDDTCTALTQATASEQGEAVAWMWQHDETGRTGFVDQWQVDNGWQANNPRCHLVSALYTAQPAPAARPMQLPSFDDCAAKKEAGGPLNPLERFVFENDPAEPEESAGFQVGLLQAIDFYIGSQPTAPAVPADLEGPTTYAARFTDAVALLCKKAPPADMVAGWLAGGDDHRLQEFAIEHGPAWAQGIGLLDAAHIMAEQPTEGVEHEAAPKPEPAVDGTELHGLDTAERVCFYEQDFYVLSNFSSFRITFTGQTFDTSEAAYHYQRFMLPEDRRGVMYAESAHDAFRYAQENKSRQRHDWDAVKVDIMRDILRAKVAQHEYVRRKLLATGERELVENSWRDSYWGWGPNKDGQNMLGKLWMQIRAELRAPIATMGTTA